MVSATYGGLNNHLPKSKSKMNEIIQFDFKGNTVRTVFNENNEPLFLAKDVCDVLEMTNTSMVISRLDEDERAKFNLGRQGEANFVTESGLFSLILGSRKAEAKAFKKWVTSEVLPSIRKHGAYLTDMKLAEMIMEPENMIKLFQTLKAEKEKRIELQQTIQRNETTIQLQQNVIKFQQPKVDYATKVLGSEGAHPVTIIAKELGMTAAVFNKKLQERGIIFKVRNTWVLSSKYQNMGYTKNGTYTYSSNGTENKTAIHMLWTEKGREFLHRIFNSTLKTA